MNAYQFNMDNQWDQLSYDMEGENYDGDPLEGTDAHHPALAKQFWETFLNAEEGDLSDEDWAFAASLSNSWQTCACGSVNDGLLRGWHGKRALGESWSVNDARPQDKQLSNLGLEFNNLIEQREIGKAQIMFHEIWAMSITVLQQQMQAGTMPERKA